MALPLPPGLTPPEVAFLCEMELVTVIPRQRMDSLPLLSGPTPPLHAARSATLPLYLALLLHRQKRADIAAPPWLTLSSLDAVLRQELDNPSVFSAGPVWPPSSSAVHRATTTPIPSPPFLPHSTLASAAASTGTLPYHHAELAELLLAHCADAFAGDDASAVRAVLRDIREVRQSKLRAGMAARAGGGSGAGSGGGGAGGNGGGAGLEGGGVVSLRGVGALEVVGERAFVAGVVGGLRALGASREAGRREREEGEGDGEGGGFGRTGGGRQGVGEDGDDDDEGMDF